MAVFYISRVFLWISLILAWQINVFLFFAMTILSWRKLALSVVGFTLAVVVGANSAIHKYIERIFS